MRQVKIADERFRELTFKLNTPPALKPGVYPIFVHLGDKRIRVDAHKVDVQVSKGLRVGLIRWRDNTVAQVLESLIDNRLEVFPKDKPLPLLDRENFDTIVVDIRAFRSTAVRASFARLLQFVHQGGRLVVFYHKDSEFNLADAYFRGAPFHLKIGKGRVTREDAPVRVLLPDHIVFTHPNTVHNKDWDGWIQERGLYFPETYTPRSRNCWRFRIPGSPKNGAHCSTRGMARASTSTVRSLSIASSRTLTPVLAGCLPTSCRDHRRIARGGFPGRSIRFRAGPSGSWHSLPGWRLPAPPRPRRGSRS